MKIVINSHNKNQIALDHLLDSIQILEEFNNYQIIVIIGGYYNIPFYEITTKNNITYIHCNHNSIDFTGLITLLELYSKNVDEYYLYLHDTCRVGSNFYKKISEIDLNNVSSMKIRPLCSMNMGIYSQRIINSNVEFLLSKKNTEENRCMEFKTVDYNEDYLFNNDPNKSVLNWTEDHTKWVAGPIDYYGTGTMRIVEYYQYLDLYKIKANWGAPGAEWTLNL